MTKEEAINTIIAGGVDTNKISDGYHTFGELYEHRIRLYMELCRSLVKLRDVGQISYHKVWAFVENESDEWFLLGINTEEGKQITYHLPARFWNEVCEFAKVLTAKPEFDGHTSADVLQRLQQL